MLLHSIYLRKFLVGMNFQLDKDEVSPSDFALIVRGLKPDCTKEKLKEEFESKFSA